MSQGRWNTHHIAEMPMVCVMLITWLLSVCRALCHTSWQSGMQETEVLEKAIGVTGTVGDINAAIGRRFPAGSSIFLFCIKMLSELKLAQCMRSNVLNLKLVS